MENMIYHVKDTKNMPLYKKYRRFKNFCVLEKYLAKGWLRLGRKDYSERDRLWAANRLTDVYFRSAFPGIKAADYNRVRVDVSQSATVLLESVLDAREEYFAAVKSIHSDYWPSVRTVCLEDKEIDIQENHQSPSLKAFISFSRKVDLCRGLDELIDFYRSR